ncbi:TonB-dependent receptor [Nitrospira japonica]|uniref:TonB-dependent receptor n=1 Tax=Nitrospira japonica TaxID=1325564 RepID=A0A1W1I4W9_9BACT|nr:TonB-dependent receptor [Nitrospira japonica]SLM48054.1 TonB-dependent receptor [Nitrospira japonica]
MHESRLTFTSRFARTICFFTVALVTAMHNVGSAQDNSTEPADQHESAEVIATQEVTVSATRMDDPLKTVSQSVTIVTKEELFEQTTINQTRNLADILPKLVPGLAINNGSTDNFGQSIRGRDILILIDAVPQYSSINNGRDFNTIDPASIERIEVVRGSTAIYGSGSSGGIINIITKKAVKGKPSFNTDVSTNMSLTHPEASFGGSLTQGVTGGKGPFDYTLTGTFARIGGQFDAKGDRTMPGYQNFTGSLADSNVANIHAKIGLEFGRHRFQLSENFHQIRQHTKYTFDPSVDATCPSPFDPAVPCTRTKARYLSGLSLSDQTNQTNNVTSLNYTAKDLFWGSRADAQLYWRGVRTLFPPFDLSQFSSPALEFPILAGRTSSDTYGGRFQMVTPLPLAWSPRLLYGADYSFENSTQTGDIFDTATYAASGGRVFQKVREAPIQPFWRQNNFGLFAQAELKPLEWVVLRGGMRYEINRVKASDNFFPTTPPIEQTGGIADYSVPVFNGGITVIVNDPINVFFNYSQGFSVPNLTALAGTVGQLNFAPVRTTNYEIGARGDWDRIQSTLAIFYNTSDLATYFDPITNTMARAPQRRWGLEFTGDVRPWERWKVGTTVSYVQGQIDPDLDGHFQAMSTINIPPVKVTGYLEHLTISSVNWRTRVQIMYSGPRTTAYNAWNGSNGAVGERFPIVSFAVVDLISTINVGPGTLRFAVENLLNTLYYTPQTQADFTSNRAYTSARGTIATIGYLLTY